MKELAVNDFSGGIINKVRPHLLPEKYAVDLLDADIEGGSIRPVLGAGTSTSSTERLSKQDTYGNRSLVKWYDRWYWSDNDQGGVNSDLGYVGVTPPTGIPSVASKTPGNKFVGRYQYAVTFETAEGFESAPWGANDEFHTVDIETRIEVVTVTAADFPAFSDVNRYTDGHRFGYLEGDTVTYNDRNWTAKTTFVGSMTPVTYAANDVPRGLRIQPWQYPGADNEFWDDTTARIVTATGSQTLALSNIPVPSDGVTRFTNIYRTSADSSNFYFLVRLPAGQTTYDDSTADSDLLLNRQLNLAALPFPPIYVSNDDGTGTFTQQAGKFLTEVDGIFYLAYGNRVYLSEQSNPHAWPITQYVLFEEDITGIAKEDVGVLVFSRNSTWLLEGSTFADISKRKLPAQQGCTNWKTIAYLRNSPMWMSNDGLCRYSFVPDIQAKMLQVVTEKAYTFPSGYTFAMVANDVYWLFYADGTAVLVDFAGDMSITRRTVVADQADYDEANDRILAKRIADGTTWWLEAPDANQQTWRYTSPEFNLETGTTKFFRSMWIDATGEVTVSATIDGRAIFDQVVSGGTRTRRLFIGQQGTKLQLAISGTCELRGFEVEYHVPRPLPRKTA